MCVLQFSGSVVVLFLLRQHTFNVSFCQHLFESEADSSVTTSTRAGEYGTHATNTATTTNVAFDLNPFFVLLFQRSINGPDADGRRQGGHYSVAVRGEPIALVHQHYRRGCSFRDGDFHEVSLLTLHLCGTERFRRSLQWQCSGHSTHLILDARIAGPADGVQACAEHRYGAKGSTVDCELFPPDET